MKEKGFILIVAMLLVFMMLAVFSFVHLKTMAHIKTTRYSGIQMESMALAELGLRKAAEIISGYKIEDVAAEGSNNPDTAGGDSGLNPLDPFAARSMNIADLPSQCGRGTYTFKPEIGKAVFFKVSLDPKDIYPSSSGRKIIVRSMGVVRNSLLESETSLMKNQVTILESLLRKDRPFNLPAPLVILDSQLGFEFEGSSFCLAGGESSSIFISGAVDTDLLEGISAALSEIPGECFEFSGPRIDFGPVKGYPGLAAINSPDFWEHFKLNIGGFASVPEPGMVSGGKPGIFLLSDSSLQSGELTGLLVTVGDVELSGSFTLDGLLIHLGNGELVLGGRSRIIGGAMFVALDEAGSTAIRLEGRTSIGYAPQNIKTAQECLPLTHLGTRIVPE